MCSNRDTFAHHGWPYSETRWNIYSRIKPFVAQGWISLENLECWFSHLGSHCVLWSLSATLAPMGWRCNFGWTSTVLCEDVCRSTWKNHPALECHWAKVHMRSQTIQTVRSNKSSFSLAKESMSCHGCFKGLTQVRMSGNRSCITSIWYLRLIMN